MSSFARGGNRRLDLSYLIASNLVHAAMRCIAVVLLTAASSFVIAKDTGADLSKTTLTTSVSSATCTVFTPGGPSRQVPCDANGWDVGLQPGEVAQMYVEFTYAYRDDGLSFSGGVVDVRCNGVPCAFDPGAAGFEFGLLEIGVNCSPNCSAAYPQYLALTSGPDSLSGQLGVFHTSMYGSTQAQSVHMDFFADATTVSVTAVPEPSTWLMMALTLPLLLGMSLRHGANAG
jgi:hypothetical protein